MTAPARRSARSAWSAVAVTWTRFWALTVLPTISFLSESGCSPSCRAAALITGPAVASCEYCVARSFAALITVSLTPAGRGS